MEPPGGIPRKDQVEAPLAGVFALLPSSPSEIWGYFYHDEDLGAFISTPEIPVFIG